jgi:hypothetical protein
MGSMPARGGTWTASKRWPTSVQIERVAGIPAMRCRAALEPLHRRRVARAARQLVVAVALAVGPGCGGGRPSTPVRAAGSSGLRSAPSAFAGEPASSTIRPSPSPTIEACGPFECRWFDSGADALGFVLADDPLAVGVGEAHALAGTESVASTARRFSEELLPSLRGRVSHLVVELLNPDPRCDAETRQVRRAQQPVTAMQSKHNQSDYVELGMHARALGIEPFVLSPTCDEFRAIADAGDGALDAMLTTIARVTARMLRGALAKNGTEGRTALVVGYGGALHNDIAPSEAKLGWSYGPELVRFTGGRYVELDLIAREFIKDSEAWRALPWYPHFDPARGASRWLVMQTGVRRYALFFPLFAARRAPASSLPAP